MYFPDDGVSGPYLGNIRPKKSYDVALKMLKCFKQDEYRIFSNSEEFQEQPVLACHFCYVPQYEHLLALANEEGKIAVQNTKAPVANDGHVITVQGHWNAIFDLAWSSTALRLVSVSGDQTANVWAVAGDRIAPVAHCQGQSRSGQGHARSIKVAAYRPDHADVFATGGRDGNIVVWDCRIPSDRCPPAIIIKPDNFIPSAHIRQNGADKAIASRGRGGARSRELALSRAESVTGLVFQDSYSLISCAAGDGAIKVWDARKCYSVSRRAPVARHCLPYAGTCVRPGFTGLSLCPASRLRLFANCMDSNVYCYNIGTYSPQPVAVYTGHRNLTFYVKGCVSGDGRYLASGSSDDAAFVWSVARPGGPCVRLNGHSAEVTCVDWAANVNGEIKMATCADDSSHRIWRVSPPPDSEETDDLAGWAEWLDGPPASRTPRPRRAHHRPLTPPQGSEKRIQVEEMSPPSTAVRSLQSLENKETPRQQLFPESALHGAAADDVMSPTSNLPNYVEEGTSPHHSCRPTPSPASKQKENWLAKLQQTPSPSQKPPPAQRATPKRRLSQSKACGNLLRFFKVEVKNTGPEGETSLGSSPVPPTTVTSR